MIKNLLKKSALLITPILIAANIACAQNYTVPYELTSYGDGIYSQVRARFGRSFAGYCGTYVSYQLRAMGILGQNSPLRGNGNRWYNNFDGLTKTDCGYYVYRESGYDCIDKLVEKYGNDLNNIVMSFPIQAGYSSNYPGAGHAFIIYKLKDGVAYYSESFSFGANREGQVIAEEVHELINRYSRRHGSPIGCVLLSDKDIEKEYEEKKKEQLQEQMLDEVMAKIETLSDVTIVADGFTDSAERLA